MVSYRTAEMEGVLWVLDTRATGDVETAADALLDEVPGGRVDTDDEALVAALVARGGRLRRRAHDMEYDLSRPLPDLVELPGYAFAPVAAPEPLAAVHRLAFAPGHVDHRPDEDIDAMMRRVLAGEVIGPFVPAASWQVEHGGTVVGAVLVVDRPAFGGMSARAWILDVFVDPAHQGRGVGDALARRAVVGAREAGFAHVGLVVSDGNPARRTYERVGFVVTVSGTTVDLPPR